MLCNSFSEVNKKCVCYLVRSIKINAFLFHEVNGQ
jgi:hypothetical protein